MTAENKKRPDVTLVMLTWNGLAVTKACLEGLMAKTRGVPFHIVVVDNGSTDGTVEWLRSLEGIRLIANPTNEGFVRGNNRALRDIPPDHDVVLINNDIEILQDDWLARLRDAVHADPARGVAGCRMRFPDGRLLHAGVFMPLHTFHGFQIGSNQADIGQYPGTAEVESVVGACLYIRSEARKAVGLLSEDYESYFEDTDYCLRARKAGFKVVCVNDVCVLHHVGSSTRERPAYLNDLFNRSRATFVAAWGGELASRYRRRLVWRSRLHEALGWAAMTRHIALALDAESVDVALEHVDGAAAQAVNSGDPRIEQFKRWIRPRGSTEVAFGPITEFPRNEGYRQVGFTITKDPHPGPGDVAACNLMDEVWVPSALNKDLLEGSGVRKPVHAVPLGFDPAFFHPRIRQERLSARFTFLVRSNGTKNHAIDIAIRAFREAFRADDDVLLVVNRMPAALHPEYEAGVQEEAGRCAAPVVMLDRPIFLQHELPLLYRAADCFVMPSRWQAFGLSLLEAMACGLPCIAAERGGHRAFFGEGNGFVIRSDAKGQPDAAHLASLMRRVYEGRDDALALGAQAARDAAAGWTWRHAARRIIERLDATNSREA
jgi:GT2 family glycosyltransferase